MRHMWAVQMNREPEKLFWEILIFAMQWPGDCKIAIRWLKELQVHIIKCMYVVGIFFLLSHNSKTMLHEQD